MGAVMYAATCCVLLMVFSPTFAEIECDKDVHENCPGISLYDTVSDGGGSISETFLVERCSDVLEDVSCKDSYLKACDPDNYQLYSLLTNGLKNLFSELCNETSDLRIGFRQHIDCFQRKSSKLRNCLFVAMEAAQRLYTNGEPISYGSSQHASDISERKQIAKLCRFQESFRSCSIMTAKNYCGKDAGQYLSTVYEKSIQDLASEIC